MSVSSGARILTFPDGNPAVPKDFLHENKRTALLIHGWAASADNLDSLASFLHRSGEVSCLVAEYESSLGAEYAANAIYELVKIAADGLGRDPTENNFCISLVGHSFGGVVGSFLLKELDFGEMFDRLITLGTPHGGVMNDNELIAAMYRVVQVASRRLGLMSSLGCQTVNELIERDKEKVLSALRSKPYPDVHACSVSAGREYLTLYDDRRLNEMINTAIQRVLRESPNDGIVVESSADVRANSDAENSDVAHINDYSDFSHVCHSEIINSQIVAANVLNRICLNGDEQ